MAKSKRNIKNFKKALLSNTVYLKENEQDEPESPEGIVLDDELLENYRILAEYMEISESELIEQALNHFLRIKAMKLEDAKTQLKIKS